MSNGIWVQADADSPHMGVAKTYRRCRHCDRYYVASAWVPPGKEPPKLGCDCPDGTWDTFCAFWHALGWALRNP